MECLPKSDYLEFQPNTLRNVRKLYGFDSAEDMRRAVDVLESWVKKQQHFTKRDFSRQYLELTIIESKGSVEKAKTRLERLCTLRTLLPQFFGDFDVRTDFSMLYGEKMFVCALPKMTDDYYRVLLVREPGNKYDGTLSLITFQNIFLLLELQKRLDYAVGQILFLDYTNTDLVNVVSNLNLVGLRDGFSIVQEGYGQRVKGMHVLTTNSYINMMVKLLQAIFSPKLMSRIHIHKKIDTVYEYIPKELLPVEYGGQERSIETLFGGERNLERVDEVKQPVFIIICLREPSTAGGERNLERVDEVKQPVFIIICLREPSTADEFTVLMSSEEQRAHVREMAAARTDEGLRSKDEFNTQCMGLPGSFRVLTVD